ncbi:MAG: Cof-type HAD-IIB family hydrolase [Eubacteriales bacterium]
MALKMIVSDLDGTLLNKNDKISDITRKAIEDVLKSGIHFVVATGRAIGTLPKQIREIEGIEYAITSNGAVTTKLDTNKIVSTAYIDESVTYEFEKLLFSLNTMVEIFVRGKAYIEKRVYDDIYNQGLSDSGIRYVLKTRTPEDDLFEVFRKYRSEIENINICFKDQETKKIVWEQFSKFSNITVTSSMRHNIELIGKNTDKSFAIKKLMNMHGVNENELMAFGDNHNDIGMIKLAGIGVAMANAEESLKNEADYITDTNLEDGVAKAIYKFAGI